MAKRLLNEIKNDIDAYMQKHRITENDIRAIDVMAIGEITIKHLITRASISKSSKLIVPKKPVNTSNETI